MILVGWVSFTYSQQQNQPVFTKVPVVNGKVVFQQFIHVEQEMSTIQQYALLNKWGKENYANNPKLSSIRFDEKNQSVTVSSKTELLLTENSQKVNEKISMNYRFDASITNAGCVLVFRDITFQDDRNKSNSFFPVTYSAEEMITDEAINMQSDSQELKKNLRRAALSFFDQIYLSLSLNFQKKN
jgi:hypothetical protein